MKSRFQGKLLTKNFYELEAPNKLDSAIRVYFRAYPDRNKIRGIWLSLTKYYEFNIDTDNNQVSPFKCIDYKYDHNDQYLKFRIGKSSQDRMFTKNDYSIFGKDNFFSMDDAAYTREFYVLHNRYGVGLASGRKNKILWVKVPLPLDKYTINFMDKERRGLVISNISLP